MYNMQIRKHFFKAINKKNEKIKKKIKLLKFYSLDEAYNFTINFNGVKLIFQGLN